MKFVYDEHEKMITKADDRPMINWPRMGLFLAFVAWLEFLCLIGHSLFYLYGLAPLN